MSKAKEKSGRTLAYWFDGKGRTLTLAQTESGELFWIGSTADLKEMAEKFTARKFYHESDGNFAAWCVRRIKKYIGGEYSVVASNIAPSEVNYVVDV